MKFQQQVRSWIGLWGALVILPVGCGPNDGTHPRVDRVRQASVGQGEPHATAFQPSIPVVDSSGQVQAQPVAPTRVYVSVSAGIRSSSDAGETFPSFLPWNCPEDESVGDCNPHVTPFTDSDILNSRFNTALGGHQIVYGATIAQVPPTNPSRPDHAIVVRSSYDGVFDENTDWLYIPKPEGTFVVDKVTIALDDRNAVHTLYVGWQDSQSEIDPAAKARLWIQRVRSGPPVADEMQMVGAPEAFWPGMPGVPYFKCSADDVEEDAAGRANLWTTTDGELWASFSNQSTRTLACNPTTRRIFVARLNGPDRFIKCIDKWEDETCIRASQHHLEESDAEMVIDHVTNLAAVTYSRRFGMNRRVVIASALTTGESPKGPWQNTDVGLVENEPWETKAGDQTQPAIALTTYDDPIDRAFSGTIYVSWYEPSFHPFVRRAARGFFPRGTQWIPVSVPFGTEEERYVPINQATWNDPTAGVRGVLEYQGITHLPGYGAGGWFSTWTRPDLLQLTTGSDGSMRTVYTRWP